MNRQRIIFTILVTLMAVDAELIRQNIFPAWTAYLTIAGVAIQAFENSVGSPQASASLAADLVRKGGAGLGVLLLAGLLAACPLPAQSPGIAGIAVKDTVCIVMHDNEPVAQIIKDCNLIGDATQLAIDIGQILTASRSRRAACYSNADAGPGK
jgi:hypothetical protein